MKGSVSRCAEPCEEHVETIAKIEWLGRTRRWMGDGMEYETRGETLASIVEKFAEHEEV